jgi:hypothetical protein
MLEFKPYQHLYGRYAVCVDGKYGHGLNLSHWRGVNNLKNLMADTSAGICINVIEKQPKLLQTEWVSANHFDIDALVSVFILLNPSFSLSHKDLLIRIAEIADFRHFSGSELDLLACKIIFTINSIEEKKFYRPFGYIELKLEEADVCFNKFIYFLNIFKDIITNINQYEQEWKEEFVRLLADFELIKRQSTIDDFPYLGLRCVKAPKPLHYYALMQTSDAFDMILSIYDGNFYELELKYTSWVDIVSRPVFPRIQLLPLAEILNSYEKSNYQWQCDTIYDTGPILRLESEKSSKSDRYAHPYQRKFYSSSISTDKFREIVIQYFTKSFSKIKPKKFWTWFELRKLNDEICSS